MAKNRFILSSDTSRNSNDGFVKCLYIPIGILFNTFTYQNYQKDVKRHNLND